MKNIQAHVCLETRFWTFLASETVLSLDLKNNFHLTTEDFHCSSTDY